MTKQAVCLRAMALLEHVVDFGPQLLELRLSAVFDSKGIVRLSRVAEVCLTAKLAAAEAAARAKGTSVSIVTMRPEQQHLLQEAQTASQSAQVLSWADMPKDPSSQSVSAPTQPPAANGSPAVAPGRPRPLWLLFEPQPDAKVAQQFQAAATHAGADAAVLVGTALGWSLDRARVIWQAQGQQDLQRSAQHYRYKLSQLVAAHYLAKFDAAGLTAEALLQPPLKPTQADLLWLQDRMQQKPELADMTPVQALPHIIEECSKQLPDADGLDDKPDGRPDTSSQSNERSSERSSSSSSGGGGDKLFDRPEAVAALRRVCVLSRLAKQPMPDLEWQLGTAMRAVSLIRAHLTSIPHGYLCICGKSKHMGMPGDPRPTCCGVCKQLGMVEMRKGFCLCGKAIPSFGMRGDERPTCCASCKTDDMVNVVASWCIVCGQHQPSYGVPGERPLHCSGCSLPGMKDLRSKRCVSCGKVGPSYGFPDSPCATHCAPCGKPLGMLNITNKRCELCPIDDAVAASFGWKGGRPVRCADHREEGMEDLCTLRCEKCSTAASFGRTGDKRPSRCKNCSDPDMVDIKSKKCVSCLAQGISKGVCYGLAGGLPTHCAPCGKKLGMKNVKVRDDRLCVACPAESKKMASYGQPGGKATHCSECGKLAGAGLINVSNKLCEDCKQVMASYGLPGGSRTHCKSCGEKHDPPLVLLTKKCESCGKSGRTYGLPGTTAATHCATCANIANQQASSAQPQLVDVRTPKCIECKGSKPSYGIPGQRATHCAACGKLKPGMARFTSVLSSVCRVAGCNKAPTFGEQGGSRTHCAKHGKQVGLLNLVVLQRKAKQARDAAAQPQQQEQQPEAHDNGQAGSGSGKSRKRKQQQQQTEVQEEQAGSASGKSCRKEQQHQQQQQQQSSPVQQGQAGSGSGKSRKRKHQ